jgi:hypothetical protein
VARLAGRFTLTGRFRATAFFFCATTTVFFVVLAFRAGAFPGLLTRDACAAASVNCAAFETMMPAVVPTVRAIVFNTLSPFAAGLFSSIVASGCPSVQSMNP